MPEYHRILSHYYSQHEGPFLLGDKVTYVDFAVYQSLDNEQKIGTLPVCQSLRLDEGCADMRPRKPYPVFLNRSRRLLKAVLVSRLTLKVAGRLPSKEETRSLS